MHDQTPTIGTARIEGWLYFLGGILMLAISIDAYLYPHGQLAPTDWIVYLAGGVLGLLSGIADILFAKRAKLKAFTKTIAALCWFTAFILFVVQRWL